MKVLHLCDHYRPIGGAEKLLFDTLDASEKKADVENIIVMNDYPENVVTGERDEFIVADIDLQPVSWNFLDYSIRGLKLRKKLRKIINRENPDVIHIHNIQNPFTIYEAIKNRPTVRSIHDPRLYCFNNWRILRKTKEICPYPLGYRCVTNGCLWPDLLRFTTDGRWALPRYASYLIHRKIDKIIVESKAMEECVLQNGYKKDRLSFLPNFTRVYKFSEVTKRNKQLCKKNENSILFVGRASFEKGINYLLEAVALLKLPYKLYLVTGGPELPAVQKKIKELRLSDNVDLVGVKSYDETRDYYSMADVVVVPSVWIESFCLVGIEAMANAKPVVAFRTGGIPDWLVDGYTGHLAKCRNVNELAEKIELLISDKKTAETMGINGYNRVIKKYSMDVYLPKLLSIYNEAIKNRSNYV